MESIQPFQINVPDDDLNRLHQKLDTATFPDELDVAGWDLGIPLEQIKRLTTYWRTGFNWRRQEKELNDRLTQVLVPVTVAGFGQLQIHCVHHASPNPNAVPLLFLHGWPGSFLEATKLLPYLSNDADNAPAFSVVVPSLPNFGFSSGVKKKGFGLAQYAECMHAVMSTLGYQEYSIQGGDWGSLIARTMATHYPTHVKAVHLNFLPVSPPLPWRNPLIFLQSLLTIPFSASSKAHLATTRRYLDQGNAYLRQQETRPQTLGYALQDSPVALLAWVADKLHDWSDGYPWTDDEILTWVSIYWFSTAGPAASVRIYYEAARKGDGDDGTSVTNATPGVTTYDVLGMTAPAGVRFAVAQFREELIKVPLFWAQMIGDVVRENEFDCGGHFAAWEVPELLARDLKGFLGKGGQAYAVVTGRDGY
ncbi:epoxide hydrolase [Aspergillus candidus]|uniref:Putative epoxide hydrolase n=1 Tax=Aspergillus candidus TaxID=41067 RepID=A0A2I2F1C3_ASPCN|nr:putative epoxide hydrolase [Aspergillus candidus]PLB34434.1 putative epoxide hydrolase [Aspergillus candidus]